MIVQSRSSLKFTLPNDWTISRLGLFGRFISGSAFPDQYQGKTDVFTRSPTSLEALMVFICLNRNILFRKIPDKF